MTRPLGGFGVRVGTTCRDAGGGAWVRVQAALIVGFRAERKPYALSAGTQLPLQKSASFSLLQANCWHRCNVCKISWPILPLFRFHIRIMHFSGQPCCDKCCTNPLLSGIGSGYLNNQIAQLSEVGEPCHRGTRAPHCPVATGPRACSQVIPDRRTVPS